MLAIPHERLGMGLVLLIFGVTLTLLGIGFLVIPQIVGKHQAELVERCSVTAEAELVGNECRSIEFTDDTSVTYHGVYAFQTDDGVSVRAENKSGYGHPDEIPGPLVTIKYNPNNPGEFVIPDEQASIAESQILPGLRRGGIAMLVVGVPLVIAAVVLMAA